MAKTLYLCNHNKNTTCTKEWCWVNGGPCVATSDEKYAWLGMKGKPLEVDEKVMSEAADKFLEGLVHGSKL